MTRAAAVVVAVALSGCHDAATTTAPTTRAPTSTSAAPIDAAPVAAPTLRLPSTAAPLAYALRLELDPDSDAFRGHVDIRVHLAAATDRVWLHAVDLAIDASTFTLAGTSVAAPLALLASSPPFVAFSFGRTLPAGDVTLALDFSARATGDQEALFRQRHDGGWYLYSQGEPVFARRIFPCFDEPGFKVPWRVTLVVPGTPPDHAPLVALANAPLVAERALADGRRELQFAETPPMPSYLVAFVVGPFELVDAGTVGRAKIPVRIATLAGTRAETVAAARAIPRVVDALEAWFDQPLPWPKLDVVAVPQFFGAMENPGLVTMVSASLLGDTGDRAHADHVLGLLAHELAHFWMGDLVTPAWWDDLWLAESFASWLADDVARRLHAFDDPALRVAQVRARAFAADAEPETRPLRPTITREQDTDDRFDAISYDKGETVLATFARTIGDDAFRAAVRAYVAAHAHGSATAADFTAALGAASRPELGDALASYLSIAGAPVVELVRRCDGTTLHLVATVRAAITVPMCVRYAGATGAVHRCSLVAGRVDLALTDARACDAWLVGNDGGLGYYVTEWTDLAPAPPPAAASLSPTEQLAFGDDLAVAIGRADLAIAAVRPALVALASSTDPYAQLAALAIAAAIDPLVDDAHLARWHAWLIAQLRAGRLAAVLRAPRTAADRELADAIVALIPSTQLPAASVRAARRDLDAALVAGRLTAARIGALFALAAPAGGRALFARVVAQLAHTTNPDWRDVLLDGLGRFGPALAPRAVDLLVTDAFPPADAATIFDALFDHRDTRATAWSAIRAHLDPIVAKLPPLRQRALIESLATLCDPTSHAEIATAFEPRIAAVPDGRRSLDRTLASIDRCVSRRAAAPQLSW